MGWWNRLVNRNKVDVEEELEQWEYSEGIPFQYMEQVMPLKEVFLNYVERQRGANHAKDIHGPDSKITKDAYEQANAYKRQMLDMIEEIEGKG